MNYQKTLVFALLCLGLGACKTTKDGMNYKADEKVLEISKGACFGSCPIYTMTIYGKGLVEYKGERFTDKLGVYTKQLSDAEYKALFASAKAANLWQFKDEYNSRIPDLPLVVLTYYGKGTTKKIAGKEGRPTEVMAIEKQLDEIAQSEGWTLKEAPDFGLPDNYIPNEIIVQLKDGVDVNVWKNKFMRGLWKAEVVKRITPDKNYWLISYDVSAMPPKDALEMIKRDKEVVEAEFNKKLTTRG